MPLHVESIDNLEKQIDKLADLAVKLKEENKQLLLKNKELSNQIKSINGKSTENGSRNQESTANAKAIAGISKANNEDVRRRIQSALVKLNHLRKAVMEAN